MKVSMIAAMAKGRVIGRRTGGIPWRLPRDVEHFRSYTDGHHLLLGRKTFEEMVGWFASHTPIVLTRRLDYRAHGALVVHAVADSIALAEQRGESELIVVGGAAVFAEAMPFADELVLTFVEAEVDGDVRFPEFDRGGAWVEYDRKSFPADEENEYGFRIVRFRPRSSDDPDALR